MTVEQRTAADPAASVWVGASAGTGKTKVLTDRVLRLLLGGTAPDRLLCITFTNAAAAEMAIRINTRLSRWATMDEAALKADLGDLLGRHPEDETVLAALPTARRLFAQVLDTPGGMNIRTIHSLCQALLKRFPLEAGLPPHFDLMDDRTAGEMLADARERVLARAAAGRDGLGRALATITALAPEEEFADLVHMLASERHRLRSLLAHHGDADAVEAAIRRVLAVPEGVSEADLVAEAVADSALDRAGLSAAVDALRLGTKTDKEKADRIAAFLAEAVEERAVRLPDYELAFFGKDGEPRKRLATNAVKEVSPDGVAAMEAEQERLQDLRARRRNAVVAEASAALVHLGAALVEVYDGLKRAHARLDYDDLILATAELLRRPGVAPWVLFKLDGGLDHMLIDEAQDTSPEQWQVIEALTEEFFAGEGARDVQRTVFAVGDSKQSIYSFQRADPAEFERMRKHFRARAASAENRWFDIDLTRSYRSVSAVLEAVDAVFNRPAARDGVAEDDGAIRHEVHRLGQAGLVEVWPAAEKDEDEAAEPWSPPVEPAVSDDPRARLARTIARTIRGWLDRGEVLESQGRAIRPGDVLVLVRRRNAFVDELVKALKALAVPVAGSDRMKLTEQLAVMDLIALGHFLLLPEDDLTLATVLKGPLIGMDEDALFRLAHPRGERSLWAELSRRRDEEAAFADAYRRLRGLLAGVDFDAPYELYANLLSAQGGRRAMVARLGVEAEDPIDEFLNLALAYERNEAPSLQGFLHWVESGQAEIKRDLEQGRDEVRIMTVHGAKGLQAPVVFLPDTMQVPTQTPKLFWPHEPEPLLLWPPRVSLDDEISGRERAGARTAQMQEYRRLLYVAMTRAGDRLYVAGWRGRREPPEPCWYNLIFDALAPLADPVEFDFGGEWGGRGLRLSRAQEVEPPTPPAGAVEAAAPPLPDYLTRPPAPEPQPPQPLTPSRPDEEEPPARSPLDGVAAGRGRFRRGLLVHRLLQSLPELEAGARRAAAVRFLSQPGHGLDPAQIEEIAAETMAVLEHEEFAPLFAPGSAAEVPITGRIGAHIVSGAVDRLAVGPGVVMIVDYKTNRPAPAVAEDVHPHYLKQMAAYRAVLSAIYPDRDVRCALLWTDGPRLMPLSDGILDAWTP